MFTANKYYKPNSAIYLNNGYLTIPPGVYFYQDFTISFWIKPYSFGSWPWIFVASNTIFNSPTFPISPPKDVRRDTVLLTYSGNGQIANGCIFFRIIQENDFELVSSKAIKIGEWSFVTAVLRGNTGYIYVNAQQTASGQMARPKNVLRVNNFIGRSEIGRHNVLADAVLDDLKIFNRALDLNEITILMNSNKNLI